MRGLSERDEAIYKKIAETWKSHGWDWDSKNGQIAARMASIIPEIFCTEFQDVRNALKILTDNLDNMTFKTDRAHDAWMLYQKLKSAGANEEALSYAVYAYLSGDSVRKYPREEDEEERYITKEVEPDERWNGGYRR